MNNLDKKQKIIVGIIATIVIGFICYYVYAKDEVETTKLENNLELEDTEAQEQETEEFSDEFILVHVSGAVNKESVVELKINSRISDAIDKARRFKRRCKY